jgi:hypothetical protein
MRPRLTYVSKIPLIVAEFCRAASYRRRNSSAVVSRPSTEHGVGKARPDHTRPMHNSRVIFNMSYPINAAGYVVEPVFYTNILKYRKRKMCRKRIMHVSGWNCTLHSLPAVLRSTSSSYRRYFPSTSRNYVKIVTEIGNYYIR